MSRRILLACGVFAAAALAAGAATLVRLTDAELVAHGDHIVLGTVSRVSTSWEDPDGDGTSQIYTTIEIRVEESLKGGSRPGETVTFRQLGGRVGNIEYRIPGLPSFREGETTLVFLEGSLTNPHYSPIPGLPQGRWHVRTNPDGSRFARRDFSDATFIRREGDKAVEDARPSEAEEPVEDVLKRFREEIGRQEALRKHNGSRRDQEGNR